MAGDGRIELAGILRTHGAAYLASHALTRSQMQRRVAQVDIRRCPHCASGVMQMIEAIAPQRMAMPRTTGPPS